MEKQFIDANTLYNMSFALAKKVFDSGYRPEYLLMLMRGAAPIGICVHEYFRHMGCDIKHESIKAVSYTGTKQNERVFFQGLEIISILRDRKVLVVDDIFDSGKTIQALLNNIGSKKNIKVATLFYKPKSNTTRIVPDFYMEETEKWVVFPHELDALSEEELKKRLP